MNETEAETEVGRGSVAARREDVPYCTDYDATDTTRASPFVARPIWESWQSQMPRMPLCTDDYNEGVFRRPFAEAIAMRHIEFNPPRRVGFLIFDCDRDDACEAWEDGQLPPPNTFMQNGSNRHGHLVYALAAPVSFGANSRLAPMKFAADVQLGMSRRLRADPAYANRMAKNPLNSHWRTSWIARQPYELNELRGWLEDGDVAPSKEKTQLWGLGRNCEIFDIVRTYAYPRVREFEKRGGRLATWTRCLFEVAHKNNIMFSRPLLVSEIHSIAKSIAKWTWGRFTDESFSELQSARGRRGAEKRWEGHMSIDYLRPWEAEGISRATHFRRKKVQTLREGQETE